jgi:DNA-binding transcriptional regulator YiaG
MARQRKSKVELMHRVHGIIGRERRVFEVRGEKIRNLRVEAGLSLRKFANKLTEKTGLIIDRNVVERWEGSAWVELSEVEMKGLVAALKK